MHRLACGFTPPAVRDVTPHARAASRRWARAVAALALAAMACKGEPSGPEPLTAPTGVTVTLVSLTSVRVDWTANPSGEKVQSYNVLREGVKVGQATTNSYVDFGLQELRTYHYTVSANGPGSAVSSPSAVTSQSTFTLPDLTGPQVLNSVPASGATNVSISAPLTITFSEAPGAATVTAANIKLLITSSGFPVAGTLSYTAGATSVTFTPSAPLSSSTGYTLNVTTGVKDPSGNQLLAAYTAPFTTAAPVDNTPPVVETLTPVDGAQDVPASVAVTATFSSDIDLTTVNGTSFTLAPAAGGATVTATVTTNASARSATLTPTAPLASNTLYRVTISTAVKDLAGNPLASAFSTTFRTSAPVDVNPPTVVVVTPTDGATNVAVIAGVQVTFSEAMSQATISGATVTLSRTSDGAPVGVTLTYDAANNRATLIPVAALANGTQFTVTVTTGARDLAGNGLAATFTSRFTTIPADITPPTVLSTVPVNGSTGVDPNFAISATFSEAMAAATLTGATFTLRNSVTSASIAGAVTFNAATKTITFTPTFRLDGSTNYAATISTAAQDLAGNALAAPFVFAFTTAVTSDNTAPTVVSTVPAANATNVDISTIVSVTFSEAMNDATLNTGTFTLRATGSGALVGGTVDYNAATNTVQYQTSAPLAYATAYTMALTGQVRDLAGNSLAPFSATFTTISPPPFVIAVSPVDRASNVAPMAPVTVTFSLDMNPATITSANFNVRNRNTSASPTQVVPGTLSYNAGNRTATFTPISPWPNSNGFIVTVTKGATSSFGEPLGSTFESCFTPGPGTGSAIASLTGFWSGDTACPDIHWHIRLIQTGTSLTLDPACPPGDCQLSALTGNGLFALRGVSIAPVASVTGTVNGTAVAFTIVTTTGLTFNFSGQFASAPDSPNPWLIGTISGSTLPAVGISFERQRP